MFQVDVGASGEKEEINLFNSNARLTLFTQPFGCLTYLKFADSNASVVDGYQNFEQEKAYAKSHWLLPFPNRLAYGTYDFEGKTYQFPQNDPTFPHALHGFDQPLKGRLINTQLSDNQGVITIQSHYDGNFPHYPFPFQATLRFCLTDHELTLETQVKNIGNTAMPVGIGWHPYFQIANQSIDTLALQLPPCEQIFTGETMLPTGQLIDYQDFMQLKQLGKTQFDHCFRVKNTDQKVEIVLQSSSSRLTLWQQTGAKGLNFFQLFTPSHRQSIAIEPMSCNINAFNNHDGLAVLSPDESLHGRLGVVHTSV